MKFERLLLCEYAVADLTTSNANVFFELGVRHAGSRSSLVSRSIAVPVMRTLAYRKADREQALQILKGVEDQQEKAGLAL